MDYLDNDPDEEKAQTRLYRKLQKELSPQGVQEQLWCKQIAVQSLRNDTVKMKIAQSALKKLITARRKGQ